MVFGLASRQTEGFLRSLLTLLGLSNEAPDHTTNSRRKLIPPRRGAQLAPDSPGTRQRNRNIRERARFGKRKWHVESGFSKRSKVETAFHRCKAILGPSMRARGLASQRVEARIGCKILNTMTALGMPESEMVG
jgi:hypothetical protein